MFVSSDGFGTSLLFLSFLLLILSILSFLFVCFSFVVACHCLSYFIVIDCFLGDHKIGTVTSWCLLVHNLSTYPQLKFSFSDYHKQTQNVRSQGWLENIP